MLNLDAAIVLLTPLYIRLARDADAEVFPYAAMPAVASLVASSALPVSNLTNLIAAEHLDLPFRDFLGVLGLPSLAAVVVAWIALRRRYRRSHSN